MAYTKFLAVAGVAAMLAACGGDSSSGTKAPELAEGSDIVADTFDDLPVCSDKREGATAYVKNEKTAYICEDGDWVKDDSGKAPDKDGEPAEGASSSSEQNIEPSSSSASNVNCSALLDGKAGWSWDVPKECRFNPDITYGTMTDERDGNVYRTVKIGDQTWMAENLNYADSSKTPSLKGKSWCYNNEAKNCDVAGRLYTWAAAIDSVKLATDADNPQDCGYGKTCDLASAGSATLVQGVCPPNWHLPTQAEWSALFTAVGGQSTVGKVLKSQSGWYSNGNGTDAFGFSALPAGYRYDNGSFLNDGYNAYFWGSTENLSSRAYRMRLLYDSDDAHLNGNYKNNGFSVRCVKD